MLKTRISIFFLLISFTISGQISSSQYQNLRIALVKNINQLRVSVGAKPLESNIILRKAAKQHCLYMVKYRKLTHDQHQIEFRTPKDRVIHFKGFEFEQVGENVLHTKQISTPLRSSSIDKLAKEMFDSWKNSPGHYANMINPDYEFGDIDFLYSQKEKIIYAAHVFGKRGVEIPGQLSDNAFGIGDPNYSCDELFDTYSNVIANMGNAVFVRGNKVMFYYHNLKYFESMMKVF